MTLIGGEAGGDERAIALSHTVRLLCVVCLLPLALRGAAGAARTAAASASASLLPPLTLSDGLALLACGVLGPLAATFVKLPAAPLVGSLALSAFAHASGWTSATPPPGFVAAAQAVVGAVIGTRFAGYSVAKVSRAALVAAAVTAAQVATCLFFAAAAARRVAAACLCAPVAPPSVSHPPSVGRVPLPGSPASRPRCCCSPSRRAASPRVRCVASAWERESVSWTPLHSRLLMLSRSVADRDGGGAGRRVRGDPPRGQNCRNHVADSFGVHRSAAVQAEVIERGPAVDEDALCTRVGLFIVRIGKRAPLTWEPTARCEQKLHVSLRARASAFRWQPFQMRMTPIEYPFCHRHHGTQGTARAARTRQTRRTKKSGPHPPAARGRPKSLAAARPPRGRLRVRVQPQARALGGGV